LSTFSRPSDAHSHSPTSPRPEEDDDDNRTFDPRAPRANYSLYPLDYLLYCEDCHQIRCPRCVSEEIVVYYCPNCLFEVPSSNLKSEGNRCAPVPSSSSPAVSSGTHWVTLLTILRLAIGALAVAFNARSASAPSP